MNSWLRLWHDMPNDPKWRTIARASQTTISDVIAVYTHLLVDGSANATERGRTQPNNAEHIASALDLETGFVVRILEAMQGRVLEGEKLKGWEKRQPKREDGSAERSKSWREKQKVKEDRPQPTATDRTKPQEESRVTTPTKKEIYRPANNYSTLTEFLRAADLFSIPDEWLTVGRITIIQMGGDATRLPKQTERFYTHYTSGPGKDITNTDWSSEYFKWLKSDKYSGSQNRA